MKYLLFLIIVGFTTVELHSQECTVESPSGCEWDSAPSTAGTYLIRVQPHVFTCNDDQTVTEFEVIDAIESANLAFTAFDADIELSWDCKINYIEDCNNFSGFNRGLLGDSDYNADDRLDIFFVGTNGVTAGEAPGIGVGTNVLISNEFINTQSILAHEVGHILNLHHVDVFDIDNILCNTDDWQDPSANEGIQDCCTDTGYTIALLGEIVENGSECSLDVSGEPPFLIGCTTSDPVDWELLIQEGVYTPAIDNIMLGGALIPPGSTITCRNVFTQEQVDRMRNYIERKQHLQDILVEEEPVCCDDPKLTRESNIDDLLELLELTDVNELATVVAEVGIECILNVDQDVTIGADLNFKLADDASIVVNSGYRMNKIGGFITPCDKSMRGIIVEDGGTLDIQDVEIDGAEIAIQLHEGSVFMAEECDISESGVGVQAVGEVANIFFQGNTVSSCDFGIQALKAGQLDIIGGENSRNIIRDCLTMGIHYWKSYGTIRYNDVENCEFGIFLHRSTDESLIELNKVTAIETGIAVNSSVSTTVTLNVIGNALPVPLYGVYTEFSQVLVQNNSIIKAAWRGIAGFSPTSLTIRDNPHIEVNGDDSAGIYLWNDANPQVGIITNTIGNNNILGEVNNGIHTVGSSNKNISANSISQSRNQGIAIEGGANMSLTSNDIFDSPDNGIGLYSSNGNILAVNQINSRNNGLLVNRLSATQAIGCNFFETGLIDIRTSAVLSPQFHHQNSFRESGSFAMTEGLSFIEVIRSRFTEEPCFTNGSNLPFCFHPEDWDRDELFLIQNFDPNIPTTTALTRCNTGPTPDLGDPEYWCWLLEHIASGQSNDTNRAWIQRYNALKVNALNNGQLIPEPCIQCNCIDCGIDDLIEMEMSVQQVMTNAGTTSSTFEDIVAELGPIITELEEIPCTVEIFGLYRETYSCVLKDMIGQDIQSEELASLRMTAHLCPETYGDVVYWARGILDHRGERLIYNDTDCSSDKDGVEGRERSLVGSQALNDIIVTPNPAHTYFTIENKTEYESLDIYIMDVHGQSYIVNDKLTDSIEIDCSNFSPGLYLIQVSHESGYNSIEKIIVRY